MQIPNSDEYIQRLLSEKINTIPEKLPQIVERTYLEYNNYNLSMYYLSEQCELSSQVIYEYVRKCLRITPINMIHSIRMFHFVDKLHKTTIKPLAIGKEIGFFNEETFRRIVNQYLHSPPIVIRRKMREINNPPLSYNELIERIFIEMKKL